MTRSNYIIVFLYLILISFLEINFFLNNISGIDQIRHLAWVHLLRDADHFLPKNFFYDYKLIFGDNNGFVFELLRYSYKDVGHTLNLYSHTNHLLFFVYIWIKSKFIKNCFNYILEFINIFIFINLF